RVDTKAGQLATLAGTLATLAAAAVTGLAALAPRASGWLLLAGTPLLVAVVVLLRRIIRPRLAGPHRGSLLSGDQVAELRGLSLVEYRAALVTRLGSLALARYRAVTVAADLLVAGFVPLLVAALGAGIAALITTMT
ncbi:MAG: hypothetical protein ACRDRZ_03460, partial [Pseudonocardiaceae bacterium]